MSASQLSLYQRCPRAWQFRYVDKVVDGGRQPRRGPRIHKQVENYLKTGVLRDLTSEELEGMGQEPSSDATRQKDMRLCKKVLPLLPEPLTVSAEVPVRYQHQGVWWRGFVDWFDSSAGIIGDLKTVYDPGTALGEEDLSNNLQAAVYALAALNLYPTRLEKVTTRWVYLPTEGQEPWAVEAGWTRSQAEETVSRHAESLRDMRSRLPLYGELPKDTRGCGAYGGCPYDERCVRPVELHVRHMVESMEEVLMDWDELVKDKKEIKRQGKTSTKSLKHKEKRQGKTSTKSLKHKEKLQDIVNSGIQTPRAASAEVVPTALPPELPLPKRKTPSKNPSILCIDCLPCFDIQLVRLDDLMIKAEQSENLRSSLKEQLQKGWQGALCVNSTTTWGKEALEVALVYADQVYRGFLPKDV